MLGITKTKCKTCPYQLGMIKCVVSPCTSCMDNKSKTHPFSSLTAMKICSKCGSDHEKSGKCTKCGYDLK